MTKPPWMRSGKAKAMAAKRTRCTLCNGAGKYHASYPWRLIDPCPRCGGTGKRNT